MESTSEVATGRSDEDGGDTCFWKWFFSVPTIERRCLLGMGGEASEENSVRFCVWVVIGGRARKGFL